MQHKESLFPAKPNSTKFLFFSKISSKIFSIFSEIKLSLAFILFKFSKNSAPSKKCKIPLSLILDEEMSNLTNYICSYSRALSLIIIKLSSPKRFLEIFKFFILVVGNTSAKYPIPIGVISFKLISKSSRT